jgi:hypothetical protein
MFEIGSHHAFKHLKHKLWSKERPGVKLPVWLPTTKSQESTQFPRVQATCDIPLESSQWRLQLCFRTHPNWRSAHEVMRLQNHRSPNCGNFGTPTWESWDKKPFATPLWVKCEDETHTPKSGNLESSGTPKNSELEFRGQNTLHWGVIYTIGKVLKCRCPKWPRMSHLDIFSSSYGQKKGRESNWQFDSRALKVGNRPKSDVCRRSATWSWKALKESYKIALNLIPIWGLSKKLWMPKVLGV